MVVGMAGYIVVEIDVNWKIMAMKLPETAMK